MRQVKRLIYLLLLNVAVSAITILLILNLWERSHPPLSAASTPVIVVVTPTQSVILPLVSNQSKSSTEQPTDTGVIIKDTQAATQGLDVIVYVVKQGDTLGALSAEFNISVADIMTVNGLTDPDSIYLGQTLRIPTSPLPTVTRTPTPTTPSSATPRPSVTSTQGPTATITQTQAGQEARLVIETVIGVGVLANEHLVFLRTGEGGLSLTGWRVSDGAGNSYMFPELTLYEDASINLNTRQGENTVDDLFWGLTSAVWQSGKTVYLYDTQDQLSATYSIP